MYDAKMNVHQILSGLSLDTTTPTKTIAQQQPLPSKNNLEISQLVTLPQLRQTNLKEQVKKQNELIKKLMKSIIF